MLGGGQLWGAAWEDVMTETEARPGGVVRTTVGLVLIFAAAPVYLRLIPGSKGWTVILGGLAALGVLVAGIALSGHWLGVFRRRRENSIEQQGCLQLLVTLFALLAGAAILYYVVYYGAGAYLRAEV
jgi:hypothetical protein